VRAVILARVERIAMRLQFEGRALLKRGALRCVHSRRAFIALVPLFTVVIL
jgi:hypothetical protein